MKHYYFLFFFLLTSIFAFSQDGCTDLEACNYNETATEDDGSCTYANACVYSAGTWINENAGNLIPELGTPTLTASGSNWSLTESTFESTSDNGDGTVTSTFTGGILTSDCYTGSVSVATIFEESPFGLPVGNINFNIYDETGEIFSSISTEWDFETDYFTSGAPSFSTLSGNVGAGYVIIPSCEACSGEQDGTGTIISVDDDGDGVCNDDEIPGCTNPETLCNYNPEATDDDGSCDNESCVGCTLNPGACNYNPDATVIIDCELESCTGCMVEGACNYDEGNTIPGPCEYAETYYDCDGNCLADTDDDGVCDELEIPGCTDIEAVCNYNEMATDDDGSCDYTSCTGCIDNVDACNYNPEATITEDCEYDTCAGCLDPEACNYDETATLDNESCEYVAEGESCEGGCLDDYTPLTLEWTGAIGGESSFSVTGNEDVLLPLMVFPTDSGTMTQCWMTSLQADCFIIDLEGPDELAWDLFTPLSAATPLLSGTNDDMTWGPQCIEGCMVDFACNYNPDAVIATDETCEYASCSGCMDPEACNYDADASNDIVGPDCEYPTETYLNCDGGCLNDTDGDGVCDEIEIGGCTDPEACNYTETATDDDGSCEYPTETYLNCDGGCLNDIDGDGVCDEIEVEGCTDPESIVYEPEATDDDGSCLYTGCTDPTASNYCEYCDFGDDSCTYIYGCTDPEAINYEENAGVDDESCIYVGCTDEEALNYCDYCAYDDDSCIYEVILGCTDLAAVNYNSLANTDDDSCIYAGCTDSEAQNYCEYCTLDDDSCIFEIIFGCTDETAINYNPFATDADGSCEYAGCTDPEADNFCIECDYDDGSCEYLGCTDPEACNYDPIANIDDGSCVMANACGSCEGDTSCFGCTDPEGCNYDENATIDDGSCDYSCYGCTDPEACNYDENATEDDGSCDYSCYGCTDPEACNYDENATIDDDSCEYAREWFLDIDGDGCGNSCFADIFDELEGSYLLCDSTELPVLDFSTTDGFNYWPNAQWVDNDDCFGESEINAEGVLVDGCDSTDLDESLSISATVYPNPVSDLLHIEFTSTYNQDVTIQLINSIGQIINSDKHIVSGGLLDLTVDMNQYPEGIYQVNLISNGSMITKTIIVK